MSFMERSNWKDPDNPRRIRIFIPLAVGLVILAGAIAAINSKVGLTAFGGDPGCSSAGADTGDHRGRRHRKGAEAVDGDMPAASPSRRARTRHRTGRPSHRVPTPSASATADPGTNPGTDPSVDPTATTTTSAPAPSAGASDTAMPGPGNGPADRATPAPPSAGPSDTAMPSATAGSPGASVSPSGEACPSPSGTMAADPNPNCTLIVPPNPLTARGLATPYRLTATNRAAGPCNEGNINQSAFVQATILDPATGKLSVYSPLVIDQGGEPAADPVVPALPDGAVVGIWFGYNGDGLTLRDTNGSLRQGRCVNGLRGSVFGQFAYCNAPTFFTAANDAIKAGTLKVPDLGTAKDGMPCPSVRDFALVDQDQSDNVQTQYLAMSDGRIAQNTAANKARLGGAVTLSNPSDNALLDVFVDPALGCTPWRVPDLADDGATTTSLALNELQAAAHQAAPMALIPQNNPMAMADDWFSPAKTNLYRAGVDQPPLPAGQTPAEYCRSMDGIQAARLKKDMDLLAAQSSPMPADADSLFTFLGMRLQASFGNLNCQNFGLRNPVAELVKRGDVVVGVKFADGAGTPAPGDPCRTTAPAPTPTASPTASRSGSPTTASPTACPATSPSPRGPHRRHGGRPPH